MATIGLDATYTMGARPTGTATYSRRLIESLAGFKKAFPANHRPWRDEMMVPATAVGQPFKSFYEEARETIKQLPRLPRALFFPDEPAAYGALKACAEKNIRVPEDLAVVGFDDEDIPYLETRLSTIHHPFVEKGREAVTMLTEILDGKLDRNAIHRKILKPHLVVRETCGVKDSGQ